MAAIDNSFEDNMLKLLTTFFLLSSCANSEKFNFTNYALYRVTPRTVEDLEILNSMISNPQLDFIKDPVNINDVVSVVTSPAYRKAFDDILKSNNIVSEVTFENIQTVIDHEKHGKYIPRNVNSMTWDAYFTLEDINTWLEDIAAANSGIVTIIKGGESFEGREIIGLKISHGSAKKSIFIEGGIHAREWLVPATVNYIISQLLYSEDPETQAAARDFDWYLFPCFNPDGYIWSWTDYRLWRKNRRPIGNEFGIDLNRNWDSNWMLNGSSSDPSSNNYAGTGPFSEPESRTLSAYIESIANNMEMYITFHTFGQMLMVPYGNTTEPLENYADSVKIARRAIGSLSVRYGTQYVAGNIAEVITDATGSSLDWVKEKLSVPLTYAYEMRDQGYYSFLLPAEQILPNNEEVMDSVLALIREGRALGYFNAATSVQASFGVLLGILLYLVK